jgi:acetylornithine deacetylase
VRALRKAKPLIAAKTAMFASEAAFFSKLAPTVIFGPGSIKQAHIPNEFIKRNDIIRTWEVLHQLVGLQCRSQCG